MDNGSVVAVHGDAVTGARRSVKHARRYSRTGRVVRVAVCVALRDTDDNEVPSRFFLESFIPM